MDLFPGLSYYGVASASVRELLVQFNLEALTSLSGVPEQAVRWGDIATRVSGGFSPLSTVAIPVRLLPLLGFEPFEGERKYKQVSVARITTKINPYQLNMEWPVDLAKSPVGGIYDFGGIGQTVVEAARQHKCRMLSQILASGFTSATIAATSGVKTTDARGYAVTIDQPGYAGASALPLFSGGVASGGSDETSPITVKHFANPLDPNSARFANLFYGIGKITDAACARSVTGQMSTADSVFGTMLTRMSQVPHPTYRGMSLGLAVTDVIGPTWMLMPFWQVAIQQLSLQISNPTGSTYVAGATTNVFNPDRVKEAGADMLMGASGLAPWRFWIAPQLDLHPYAIANAGKQMWFAVSRSKPSLSWAELAAPTKQYTPKITLLGENTEEALKSRMIRLLGDLDAGGAAGLPHCIQMYTETAPAS
jgi:hypothetical protein